MSAQWKVGDDLVTVEYADNVIFDKHFTVEMWIRPTEYNVTQKYSLF